ncbi:MAG TPA: sortase [Candidatus Saccharimonadales bacterium]|nr:sortase [Candidatus Saccharimonadales bacterium]
MCGLIFFRKSLPWAAALLVVVGGAYLVWPQVQSAWQRHEGAKVNATQLAQASKQIQPSTSPTMQLSMPASITLPRLNITLGVKPGAYTQSSQTWTIDRTHAFYMQGSGEVPAPVTPIIYGHDIPAVFMPLSGVASQELLRVTNTAGATLLFAYRGDTTVDPNNANIREANLPNTVLLMTCSGAHFEHRRVLMFSYIGVVS